MASNKSSKTGAQVWLPHIVQGEPYACAWKVQELTKQHEVSRFDATDETNLIIEAGRSFSFDRPRAIVVRTPNADQSDKLVELSTDAKCRAKMFIIVYDDKYADERRQLFKLAKNKDQVHTYGYIKKGDSAEISRCITNWLQANKAEIAEDAVKWLIGHAPVVVREVKGQGKSGKAPIEVYDLYALFNDLDKLQPLAHINSGRITLRDVRDVLVVSDESLFWGFSEAVIQGKRGIIEALYEQQLLAAGSVIGLCARLTPQVLPAFSVASCIRSGIRNAEQITALIDLGPANQKYDLLLRSIESSAEESTEDKLEAEEVPKTRMNPWRVQRIMDLVSGNDSTERLADMLNAIQCAQMDALAGMNEGLVAELLRCALVGGIPYRTPHSDDD